jgi:hypothetical protein
MAGAAIQRPVAEWRLKKHAILADATTSSGQRRKAVLKTGDITFSTPWDSDQTPESIGLTEGAELADVRLLIGDSGKQFGPLVMIVESLEVINDSTKDIDRLVVVGYCQGAVPGPVNVVP